MTIRILGAALARRPPDPALLALRQPAFREAMMHGIEPEARHALAERVLRPLARLVAAAAGDRAGVYATAALPLLAHLDGASLYQRGLGLLLRLRAEGAQQVLAAMVVLEFFDDHEAELRRRAEQAQRAAKRRVAQLFGFIAGAR